MLAIKQSSVSFASEMSVFVRAMFFVPFLIVRGVEMKESRAYRRIYATFLRLGEFST